MRLSEFIWLIALIILGLTAWVCFVYLLLTYVHKYTSERRAHAWTRFGEALVVFGITAAIFTVTH